MAVPSRSQVAEYRDLKREIDAGRMVGPTMFTTGPYLTGEQSTSSTMTRLEDEEQARRVGRKWAEEGVEWFKAYTWISRAELGAAIDEAHELGVQVTAHLCSVGYREAVALGIDNLEHGLFANSEYDPSKQPDECPPGFCRVEFALRQLHAEFGIAPEASTDDRSGRPDRAFFFAFFGRASAPKIVTVTLH